MMYIDIDDYVPVIADHGSLNGLCDFDLIREDCRSLALCNEFAINAVENRINYVIGQGHRYHIVPKQPRYAPLADEVNEVLHEFLEENDWTRRQQEIMRRRDRDGEVFLRLFPARQGTMKIRFVEPEQIYTPTEYLNKPSMTYGIQTEPHDVETVLGYWVDGHFVEGYEMMHRKANVDGNVKRGLPLLMPVRKNLRRAEKLLRNMSVVAEIQSAIALIRKHPQTSREAIRQFVQNQASKVVTDGESGENKTFRHFTPGTIIDSGAGTEYEFPAAAIDASRYILVLQAELRAIASRLVMPEFMLSSDASNANYSSTLIAEGPSVRMFERLQQEVISEDLKLFKRVLQESAANYRLPHDVFRKVSLHAIPPILAVRDRLNEAKADTILYNLGVLSKETLGMRYGLDPVQEERLDCRCVDENYTEHT
jgi:capsid protein